MKETDKNGWTWCNPEEIQILPQLDSFGRPLQPIVLCTSEVAELLIPEEKENLNNHNSHKKGD